MTNPPPHRRTQNLLLFQKLLALRDGSFSSPFTLVLDTIEQSGKGVVKDIIGNALASRIKVIFISFETLQPRSGVNVVIKGNGKAVRTLGEEIKAACAQSPKTLLIFDTLHPLCTKNTTPSLPTFLSSLLTPSTSLLATYHLDIPLPIIISSSSYQPAPLTLLRYLATTILTTHSFPQTMARARAAGKSLPEPVFGLGAEREGVVLGAGANDGRWGVVVEMEHRRKSGRTVSERYVYVPRSRSRSRSRSTGSFQTGNGKDGKPGRDDDDGGGGEKTMLLDDHPLYRRSLGLLDDRAREGSAEDQFGATTFDLRLTRKQRDDRAGVVLPYFDAQREESGGGGGGGGRILYDMGVEDDFDEEEDEI